MAKVVPIDREISFGENEFIVSKTNLKGNITYGNRLFIKISGYDEKELIGAPHSILRHPDMPRSVFALLWRQVAKGEEIFAFVKNLAKDGSFYWVKAQVTPSFDGNGKIIGYHSVRRKPSRGGIEAVSGLYRRMLSAEQSGGIDAGGKVLEEFLKSQRLSYDEFIFSL